jgi:hypothetical protein
MSAEKVHRAARPMRWAARIIVTIITIYGAMMLIGESVSELLSKGSMAPSTEGVLLGIIGLVALAGCILSWLRDFPAGILLVITSAALGAHIGFCAGRHHLLVWAMLGLPYLIAGVLILYAWRLSRYNP